MISGDVGCASNYATPLCVAALYNCLEAAKCLIENGAKINHGIPLISAASNNSFEVARFLIDNSPVFRRYPDGAMKKTIFGGKQKYTGNTAIHCALSPALNNNKIIDMVKLLVDGGADVTIENEYDQTPLDLAKTLDYNQDDSKSCLKEIILLLSKNEDNIEYERVRRLNNELRLILANSYCSKECLNKIIELIKNGADVNTLSKKIKSCIVLENIYSPLMYAAQVGDKNSIEFLLDKGADCYYQTCDYNTPLSYAVLNGNLEVIEMLLKCRVVNIKDSRALEYAAYKPEVQDFIKKIRGI